jgi:hypothetical protein
MGWGADERISGASSKWTSPVFLRFSNDDAPEVAEAKARVTAATTTTTSSLPAAAQPAARPAAEAGQCDMQIDCIEDVLRTFALNER